MSHNQVMVHYTPMPKNENLQHHWELHNTYTIPKHIFAKFIPHMDGVFCVFPYPLGSLTIPPSKQASEKLRSGGLKKPILQIKRHNNIELYKSFNLTPRTPS